MQIVIIGGGVVGLNVALEFAARPELVEAQTEIFLLEKEKFLGHHTSTRNSEVIHAGFAYPPESLKSKLCVEGNTLTYELLDKLRVPYKKCGKWVIACGKDEDNALAAAEKNAHLSGVKKFKRVSVSAFYNAEPSACNVTSAAFSPTSGIMDAASYIRALEVAISSYNNVNIIYPCRVTGIDSVNSTVETGRGPIKYDLLINSGGLWADEVYSMTCRNADFQMCSIYEIVPFKGEYYTWRKGQVQTMIYPVPRRFI
ncbi:MAG: FAD-dependent oxidoreductase, partial [Deltaproteobacteria bacterium]|nr:FAD-dependent oxidoreductase [Deltaproteobacteria bacterium]